MNSKEIFFSGCLTSFAFMTGIHLQSEGLTWKFFEGRLFVGLFTFLSMYLIYKVYTKYSSKKSIDKITERSSE